MTNYSDRLVSFIWDVADLLRGPYRPPEYRKVMLNPINLQHLISVMVYHLNRYLPRLGLLKRPAHRRIQRTPRRFVHIRLKCLPFGAIRLFARSWGSHGVDKK